MTVVLWVQGADRERTLIALPAAKPSRVDIALRFCRRREEGSTGSTPLVGRSGGGGRRRGAGQPRGRARVTRRRAAGVHPSRARDASASRVVAKVAAQTATEMSLAQDDHVVEKLTAEGADDSLREGVLPGGARWRENPGDA